MYKSVSGRNYSLKISDANAAISAKERPIWKHLYIADM